MSESKSVFPCTMCGACCTRAFDFKNKLIAEESDVEFDVPIKEDGTCGHLISIDRPDGLPGWGCAIYDTRPDVCRTEVMCPSDMTTEDYFRISADICNAFQIRDGIADTYRVKIK